LFSVAPGSSRAAERSAPAPPAGGHPAPKVCPVGASRKRRTPGAGVGADDVASDARGKAALRATRLPAGRFMRWQARSLVLVGRDEEFEGVLMKAATSSGGLAAAAASSSGAAEAASSSAAAAATSACIGRVSLSKGVRRASMGPGRAPARWRRRPDVPRLKARRLGVRAAVLQIARSRTTLSAAIVNLNEDMFAATTRKTKVAKLALAEEVGRAAGFGDLYPLSVGKVEAVAAAFKGAGYRSAIGYLRELKLRHAEMDFAIGPALARYFQKLERGLSRGLGPPERAPEMVWGEVKIDEPLDLELIGSLRSWAVATAWLLREIELAGLDASTECVEVLSNGDVRLALAVSKSDPCGRGVLRTLACVCHVGDWDGVAASAACGACAVKGQLRALEAQFGGKARNVSGCAFPLFPTAGGMAPTKAAVIAAWSRLSSRSLRLRGHSARRSGAKTYARLGWLCYQIQFMGRWASAEVLKYVEEAFGARTADWCRCTATVPPVEGGGGVGARGGGGAPGSSSSLAARSFRAEQLAELGVLVLSRSTAHVLLAGCTAWPRPLWTTACGWRFSGAHVRLIDRTASGTRLPPRCGKRGCIEAWARDPLPNSSV
jgi:hypothetical protein